MTHSPRVIEGAYFGDILAQPAALEQTLKGLDPAAALGNIPERLKAGEFRRVVLTGMGSSLHALWPLYLDLVSAGIPAILAETSELIHYQTALVGADSLVVAVSQSGGSIETIRLLDMAGGVTVIAVTNTPDGPLAQRAQAVLLTHAGSEFSVSCKTYLAGLMALRLLSAALTGGDLAGARDELSQAGAAVAGYLKNWRAHVDGLFAATEGIRHLFYAGRGPSLAAVGTAALTTKESTHYPCEGLSSAAFRHGPMEMLSRESLVVIFAGDPSTQALNAKLRDEITAHGFRSLWIGEDSTLSAGRLPEAPAGLRPILEMLPAQLLTLALAAQAGREAGRFSLASKVTSVE